ncbi:type II toxin-antitoxin system HicB family antitoxin [Aggregatibacter actinomycetemcomitans]|uniref:type II toxin-antitoxin system HicB family antitoxin n=1 Tax=Aggregatibacter actinomycetemcomitans TaxID=714 RepID=UPI00197B0C66|nr:type II toxin-antitoxin system HicB family antitoxin [Aggregatibacter actinomycetemcomitans]
MLYPIGVENGGEKHAYGVIVPDIPGCFSAGDTLEEAIENAKEAITLHIEEMLKDGENIPLPRDVKMHMENTEYEGLTFLVVDVDLTDLTEKQGRSA